jgi:hypothetical protein
MALANRGKVTRNHLIKVFWPNLCVGSSFQLLGILEYACGLNLDSALTLNQNPIFEMASKVN